MGVKRDFKDSTYNEIKDIFSNNIGDDNFWGLSDWIDGFETLLGINNLKDDMSNINAYLKRVCKTNDTSIKALNKIIEDVRSVENKYVGQMQKEKENLTEYYNIVKVFTDEMNENFPSNIDFNKIDESVNYYQNNMIKNGHNFFSIDESIVDAELDKMRVKKENGTWKSIDWEYVQDLLISNKELSNEEYMALYMLFLDMRGTDDATVAENLEKYLNSCVIVKPNNVGWEGLEERPTHQQYHSFHLEKSPVFEKMVDLFAGTKNELINIALDPAIVKDKVMVNKIESQLSHILLLEVFQNEMGVKNQNGDIMPEIDLYNQTIDECLGWMKQNPDKNVPWTNLVLGKSHFGNPVMLGDFEYFDKTQFGKNSKDFYYDGGFEVYIAKDYGVEISYNPRNSSPTAEINNFWYGPPKTSMMINSALLGKDMVDKEISRNLDNHFEPLKPKIDENAVSNSFICAVGKVAVEYIMDSIGLGIAEESIAFLYEATKSALEDGTEASMVSKEDQKTLDHVNSVVNIIKMVESVKAAGGIMQYSVKDGKYVLEYVAINKTEFWWRIQSYNKENNRSHSYDEVYNVLFTDDALTKERELSSEEKELRIDFIRSDKEEYKDEIKDHLLGKFTEDYGIKNGTEEGAEEMFNSLSSKGLQKLIDTYGYGEKQ